MKMRAYEKEQAAAKAEHLGIWRYGDAGDDDEAAEFGYRKPTAHK